MKGNSKESMETSDTITDALENEPPSLRVLTIKIAARKHAGTTIATQ